jgi:hypothetical protein
MAFMKKLALCCAFLSFFLCYLEWGSNPVQSGFVFSIAYTVFFESKDVAGNFSHPFILLPFTCVLMLLYQAVKPLPNRRWVLTGLALPGLLVVFLLFIGALTRNIKIIASTLPFLASAWWVLRLFGKKRV